MMAYIIQSSHTFYHRRKMIEPINFWMLVTKYTHHISWCKLLSFTCITQQFFPQNVDNGWACNARKRMTDGVKILLNASHHTQNPHANSIKHACAWMYLVLHNKARRNRKHFGANKTTDDAIKLMNMNARIAASLKLCHDNHAFHTRLKEY